MNYTRLRRYLCIYTLRCFISWFFIITLAQHTNLFCNIIMKYFISHKNALSNVKLYKINEYQLYYIILFEAIKYSIIWTHI